MAKGEVHALSVAVGLKEFPTPEEVDQLAREMWPRLEQDLADEWSCRRGRLPGVAVVTAADELPVGGNPALTAKVAELLAEPKLGAVAVVRGECDGRHQR
jgi:hypothetical protein